MGNVTQLLLLEKRIRNLIFVLAVLALTLMMMGE